MSQLNPQVAPYNYERMTSTMNQMNINDKLYNPSVSTIGNQSSEFISETNLRRDNEIDRLRMRLLLLEQQQATQSNMNISDPVEMRYKNFEKEAAYLRNHFTSYNNTKATISELEHLLNQREFEIQELKRKFAEESQKMDREIVQCKHLASIKEEQFVMEKTKSNTLQKEIDKLNSKLNECNRYITELPTKDELKQNENKFAELKSENDAMRQKLVEYEKKHGKAKQFIRDKNFELAEFRDKIEKLELEKEKLHLEFQNYKIETQSVGELMDRCKENANLKAELEISHKFIANLQEKLSSIELKYKEEISELNACLEDKENSFSKLKKENDLRDKQISDMKNEIRELNCHKKSMGEENGKLVEKITSLETALSSDALKLMRMLFKELNLAIKDLNLIVTNSIDIYHGNQVDICSLLGTAKQCAETFNFDQNETILNTI
ncbi:centrosomal of 85 kDa-like isoform X1 [Brachionus plicatilis]|uniref:Centrosomal of 85 kDa-like isoform X1 n=1 Tax=Brachionus plicatilis TaxID=10195 RepID=A0A3M7SWV9_BRAPC|nr:centrosomal of 85 kDa-like isoform X1 [Brachionus plicatilis]